MIRFDIRRAVPWAVAILALAWIIARGPAGAIATTSTTTTSWAPPSTVCSAVPSRTHTGSGGDAFTTGPAVLCELAP